MSFLGELKRRNVFRVAAAYLVSAWLLIEIGSLMFEAFGFPDWAAQMLIMVLALGLIPTVIFAWAYELTPEGVKRESEVDRSESITPHTGRRLDQVTIVMILLALGVIMVDNFVLEKGGWPKQTAEQEATEPSPEPEPTIAAEPPEPAFEPDPNSVAVLPFVNMSPDPDNEYFSDGISEELLNLLVRIEELRVPSRTSSFAFKGRNTDIREIARTLDVAHVLEGSVRKAGDKVRITAQLIDVRNDRHVWSDTYDRELTDIFAIQDEIAEAIIESLQVALGTTQPAPKRVQPENFEAYDLYLQGLHLFRQRGDALLEAEKLLRQAVESDPKFAYAWATLALTYSVQPYYVDVSREEAGRLSRDAARRALELDADLADAKAVLALLLQWEDRWGDAMEAYNALIAEHPRHALGHIWHGINYMIVGHTSKAEEQLRIAYELDPVSGVGVGWYASAMAANGQWDIARKMAKRALQLARDNGYSLLFFDAAQSGFEEPLPGYSNQEIVATYALIREALEEDWTTEQFVDSAEEAGLPTDAFVRSELSLNRMDAEGFFNAAEESWRINETILAPVWYPRSKPLRNSDEFVAFADRHGLMRFWREHGWPDRCRPAGEGGFVCD
ncbi:MAG: hypothetical protein R3200_05170 [Xanthomonadales bacterium]|nr:hypothetical protein [Xanthomonadales bacterium]